MKFMKIWGSKVSFQIHPLSHQPSRCLHGRHLRHHPAAQGGSQGCCYTQRCSRAEQVQPQHRTELPNGPMVGLPHCFNGTTSTLSFLKVQDLKRSWKIFAGWSEKYQYQPADISMFRLLLRHPWCSALSLLTGMQSWPGGLHCTSIYNNWKLLKSST